MFLVSEVILCANIDIAREYTIFMVAKTSEWQKQLGAPDIRLSGLQIWIHSRTPEDDQETWGGNWLRVTVHCGALGSDVWADGEIIHLSEMLLWHAEIEQLHKMLTRQAKLSCVEPELDIVIKSGPLGRMTMEVSITPDHMNQRHSFEFEIDQSYLQSLLDQLRVVFQKYPVRSKLQDQ